MPLLDEDYLILSTIHSAKGQEWESVYLLNVVGRLHAFRGAGTSAERSGFSYTANMRRAIVTSMLRECASFPKNLLGLFERTAWPLAPVGTAARAESQGPKSRTSNIRAGTISSRLNFALMKKRYCFDLREGDVIAPDDEGAELATLEAVAC